MLSRERILDLFEQLDGELRARGQRGEIGIVGGAVMCVVYKTRDATRDVDAIFEPSDAIREAAARIAEGDGPLPPDWLNDAAKGFVVPGFERETVLDLPNLLVWAPEPRYMLAMKCISARYDGHDRDDVAFLVTHLGLREPIEVFDIIECYYPKREIPAKTQFFIEELLTRSAGEPAS